MPPFMPAAARSCKRCSTPRRARAFRPKRAPSSGVLEGDDHLPTPDFVVGTSEPCQQGERVLADLVRDLGCLDRYHLLHTPIHQSDRSVESIAAGLEASVAHLERSLGMKMDWGRLKQACALSNEAQSSPFAATICGPQVLRCSAAARPFCLPSCSRNCGAKRSWSSLQRTLLEELCEAKKSVEREIGIDDTHRLVWLHLPPFYSSRLMDFIELTCNAPVVFEEVNFVGWQPLDPEEPVSQSRAEVADCRFSRSRASGRRDTELRRRGQDYRVPAV